MLQNNIFKQIKSIDHKELNFNHHMLCIVQHIIIYYAHSTSHMHMFPNLICVIAQWAIITHMYSKNDLDEHMLLEVGFRLVFINKL